MSGAPLKNEAMVHFIGAGPGDPDLLTIKGRRLIEQAGLVLYAGSLVPPEVVAFAAAEAEVADSAPLTLEETHELMRGAVRAGKSVARVHTGDPSLYGAVREQMALLERDGINYETVPGVTASFAAAAAMNRSFTVPETTQTLIITRLAGRTPVPEAENLRSLAAHGCAMAIYLSAGDPEMLQAELLAGGMEPTTLVGMGCRVGWPDQQTCECTLDELATTARKSGFTRQTVFLVLPGEVAGGAESLLYDKTFSHGFRKGKPPAV